MITSLLLATFIAAAPAAVPAAVPAAAPAAAPTAVPAAVPGPTSTGPAPSAQAATKAAKPGVAPAAAPGGPVAPKAPIVIETKRGKLEFAHTAHTKSACADCHRAEGPPGKIGIKGMDAAHNFCLGCHKAEKRGPQKCTSCHKK